MKRIDKIKRNVLNFARANYARIEVQPAVGLFNFRCFQNAVQYAVEHGGQIFECIMVYDGWPSLHYVNYIEGEYLETTLGYKARSLEYYVTREIHKLDWDDIEDVFDRTLDQWYYKFTNVFDRKILRIDRVV